jgi:hypothetical protein
MLPGSSFLVASHQVVAALISQIIVYFGLFWHYNLIFAIYGITYAQSIPQ